jgi:hypothetical protein
VLQGSGDIIHREGQVVDDPILFFAAFFGHPLSTMEREICL